MGIESINFDATYDLMKSGLKASNVRAKTIANNMANINTKNYKRFNVVFEDNLKNEKSSELELKRTNPAVTVKEMWAKSHPFIPIYGIFILTQNIPIILDEFLKLYAFNVITNYVTL